MLGEYFNKPVIEVNHIVGHLVSLFLERKLSEIQFPMLVLTVSGGHNDLYLIETHHLHKTHYHTHFRQNLYQSAPLKKGDKGGSRFLPSQE